MVSRNKEWLPFNKEWLPFWVAIIPGVPVLLLGAEGFGILMGRVFDPAHTALLEEGVTAATSETALLLRWLLFCAVVGGGMVACGAVLLLGLAYLWVFEAWILRRFMARDELLEAFSGLEHAPVIGRMVGRKTRRLTDGPGQDRPPQA